MKGQDKDPWVPERCLGIRVWGCWRSSFYTGFCKQYLEKACKFPVRVPILYKDLCAGCISNCLGFARLTAPLVVSVLSLLEVLSVEFRVVGNGGGLGHVYDFTSKAQHDDCRMMDVQVPFLARVW